MTMDGTRPDESPGHKKLRSDIQGDDTDSDDEIEANARALGSRKSHLSASQLRDRKDKELGIGHKFHPSLVHALDSDPVALAKAGRYLIRKTTAMAGEHAETMYRQHRPASRNSTFILNARDDLQMAPSPSKAKRLGRTATAPVGMSRTEAKLRGYGGAAQQCPLDNCPMTHNTEHMRRFSHRCKNEDFCPNLHDPEHCRLFWHDPTPEQLAKEEIEHLLITKGGGWEVEKLKLECLPTRSASLYQNSNPPISMCPRGKFRRNRGTTMPTELSQISRGDAACRDTVSLIFEGLSHAWDKHDFACFVRDRAGHNVVIKEAKVFMFHGHSSGRGRIVVGSNEEAASLIKKFNGYGFGAAAMKVQYENLVCPVAKGLVVATTFDKRGINRPVIDLSVRQFNNRIRECGPYAMDALALKERMEMEGHKPDSITYTNLIRSFKDAQPPMPERCEALVWEMVDRGMPPNATQCNLVMQAWTKSGNMKKAERFAEEMEPKSLKREKMALATSQTYEILQEGWRLQGVADLIQDRQEVVGTMPKPTNDRINVFGANNPAKTSVALWARKRSGYMPLSTGFIAPAYNHKVPWKDVIMNKWRSVW